jgi:hypothetical protein
MDRNTVSDAATSHADARDDQDVTDARAHVAAATDHYKRAASGKPPPVTVVPAPGTPQPVRKAPPPAAQPGAITETQAKTIADLVQVTCEVAAPG